MIKYLIAFTVIISLQAKADIKNTAGVVSGNLVEVFVANRQVRCTGSNGFLEKCPDVQFKIVLNPKNPKQENVSVVLYVDSKEEWQKLGVLRLLDWDQKASPSQGRFRLFYPLSINVGNAGSAAAAPLEVKLPSALGKFSIRMTLSTMQTLELKYEGVLDGEVIRIKNAEVIYP